MTCSDSDSDSDHSSNPRKKNLIGSEVGLELMAAILIIILGHLLHYSIVAKLKRIFMHKILDYLFPPAGCHEH